MLTDKLVSVCVINDQQFPQHDAGDVCRMLAYSIYEIEASSIRTCLVLFTDSSNFPPSPSLGWERL